MAAPNRRPGGLQGVNARDGPGDISGPTQNQCGRGLAPDDGASGNTCAD
ncbi:hypothetical protein C4J85_1066 [Pseudomonas sp. R4-34-07]|nr:hypothetical protein C4J85_1066 [Pseudomonas sp. R4-34-07]